MPQYPRSWQKSQYSFVPNRLQDTDRLLRTKDHGWYINKVIDEHNHRFSTYYSENKQWNSHREIDGVTRDFIRRLRENNVTIVGVCRTLAVTDGNGRVPMRKKVVCSICAKLSQENMKDDIGKTLSLLENGKSNDPAMRIRFQLDNEGRIKYMLWCTGKNHITIPILEMWLYFTQPTQKQNYTTYHSIFLWVSITISNLLYSVKFY